MTNNNENEDERIIDEIIEVDLPATFGDICEVEGYGVRVFRVFGYRIENCFTEERAWVDVVYELIDAVNGEWLEADADDVELLADAEDADVYMQTIDYDNYPKSFMETVGWGTAINNEGEALGMAKKGEGERKPTARELSAKLAEERKKARKERKEKIDNELDRYNFFKRQFDRTQDRRDKEAMDTVMAEIKKLRNDVTYSESNDKDSDDNK